jgi:rhodanese-related sulfurtransferase
MEAYMDVISSRSLMARLGEDEVVVVDCRSDEDWSALPLQIPGAIRMSCDEIHATPLVLPDDELIVLYDHDGASAACRRAIRILQAAGRSAAALEGGLRGWVGMGFPTEGRLLRRRLVEVRIGLSADPR